ncbi:MAG: type II toxin-antitoxin system VapC family toxin [Deltaproteobacteria bacterium]|nr:type II toxin-antitoxin system VapC family toxin [Deltaproteobacteria bacterium]
MKSFVVDASVVLKWYLPDEQGVEQALYLLEEFVEGKVTLHAPDLIDYEFTNAMWVAGQMGRINLEARNDAVNNFLSIEIAKTNIKEFSKGLLMLATKHNRSCYDAAYLALSDLMKAPLVTGDKRLFNAVKDSVSSLIWIEDIELSARE